MQQRWCQQAPPLTSPDCTVVLHARTWGIAVAIAWRCCRFTAQKSTVSVSRPTGTAFPCELTDWAPQLAVQRTGAGRAAGAPWCPRWSADPCLPAAQRIRPRSRPAGCLSHAARERQSHPDCPGDQLVASSCADRLSCTFVRERPTVPQPSAAHPVFLLPALLLLAKGAAPAAARHAAEPDTATNRLACWRLQPLRRLSSETCKLWSRACMHAKRGCLADHLTGFILGLQRWTAWSGLGTKLAQPKPSMGNFFNWFRTAEARQRLFICAKDFCGPPQNAQAHEAGVHKPGVYSRHLQWQRSVCSKPGVQR